MWSEKQVSGGLNSHNSHLLKYDVTGLWLQDPVREMCDDCISFIYFINWMNDFMLH